MADVGKSNPIYALIVAHIVSRIRNLSFGSSLCFVVVLKVSFGEIKQACLGIRIASPLINYLVLDLACLGKRNAK
jgi:hypothetical protein